MTRCICALIVLGLFAETSAVFAGSAKQDMNVNGVAREYLLHMPATARAPAPVVIALHGNMGTAEKLEKYMSWNAVADREGFAVVYPQGIDNAWNDGRPARRKLNSRARPGDDVTFLNALADKLVADHIALPGKIYLTGLSNGGFMTMRMACEASSKFAGFAPVIASAPVEYEIECRWPTTFPVLLMGGTADALVKWDGNASLGTLALPKLAQVVASANGCTASNTDQLPDSVPSDGSTVAVTSWTGCKAGGAVQLYAIIGGGHQPPLGGTNPSRWLVNKMLGSQNRDIDAAETIWTFFKANAR
jgi:polyhydroxybutyrate depolymerase